MKAQLQNDIKDAMRAKEREKVTTLRSIMAEIQEAELQKKGEALTEEEYIGILNRIVNQRRESIAQFKTADRADLVEAEERQLAFVLPYLPEQLEEEKVLEIIDNAIKELGVSDMSGMGRVMGLIRPLLLGKADMGQVSAWVKERLN